MAKSEMVEFEGKIYRRRPDAKQRSDRVYFHCGSTGIRLHVAIWESVNGRVPAERHIHHVDGNPLNNEIANLLCVAAASHAKLHPDDDERRAWRVRHLAQIRSKTVEWHRSEEGRAWHREHGRQAFKKRKPITKRCAQCGKSYEDITRRPSARFCSGACKSAWRRAQGSDLVERVCPRCSRRFMRSKYSKTKYCTQLCGVRAASEAKAAGLRPKR